MDDLDCLGMLTGDILRDCLDNNVGGIEVNLLVFNKSDIDITATTFSATSPTTMTNFALKTGKTGFLVKGVKQVNALRFEMVVKELSENMFKHFMTVVIPNVSAENMDRLTELSRAEVVVIVETKFKGTDNADAFKVGGYYSGLRMATAVYSSAENDGSVQVELSSVDGYEESKPILTLLETDYTTTKTAFENKFETV